MTETAIQEGQVEPGVPAPPVDDENPALIDALKTFRVTAISAVFFVLAAVLIILSTRMG